MVTSDISGVSRAFSRALRLPAVRETLYPWGPGRKERVTAFRSRCRERAARELWAQALPAACRKACEVVSAGAAGSPLAQRRLAGLRPARRQPAGGPGEKEALGR